jgi:hypothetical protein
MRPLLEALERRGLFFMDSVTSQRTVGFALAQELGMAPRINNVFLDHFESDADSRRAVLELALDAAHQGGAIGIGHVFHPYVAHALEALAPQLGAKGFVFAPLSQVTDGPAGSGLDVGVRIRLERPTDGQRTGGAAAGPGILPMARSARPGRRPNAEPGAPRP